MPLLPWATRGAAAERRAARHLQLRGWRIVARNWRSEAGELDLVASRWRTLLVVEVRRRRSLDAAWASIDGDKLERTLRTAHVLIRRHHLERYRLQLDLIGIDDAGHLHRRADILRDGLPGR